MFYDIGFSDDCYDDVIFVRLMREFVIKEIVLYNFFNNVRVVVILILFIMSYLYVSIDCLIEEFVSGF